MDTNVCHPPDNDVRHKVQRVMYLVSPNRHMQLNINIAFTAGRRDPEKSSEVIHCCVECSQYHKEEDKIAHRICIHYLYTSIPKRRSQAFAEQQLSDSEITS